MEIKKLCVYELYNISLRRNLMLSSWVFLAVSAQLGILLSVARELLYDSSSKWHTWWLMHYSLEFKHRKQIIHKCYVHKFNLNNEHIQVVLAPEPYQFPWLSPGSHLQGREWQRSQLDEPVYSCSLWTFEGQINCLFDYVRVQLKDPAGMQLDCQSRAP